MEEIERWILSWGNHAEVLAPPQPKDQISKKVSALAETYRRAA
jgi:predicted DNA-binding transcriptional regulator YafY